MAKTAAKKKGSFAFELIIFREHFLKNCLLKTIVETEAPKEFLDKFTIEDFELSFIKAPAVMYSIKNI